LFEPVTVCAHLICDIYMCMFIDPRVSFL